MVESKTASGLTEKRSELPQPVWRWRWLAGSGVLAAFLLGSLFFPPFDGLWQRFDLAVFRLTNESLAWGYPWQVIWALTNHRAFDAVAGSVFMVIFLFFIFRGRGLEVRCIRLAAGAFIFAWTVMVLDFSSDWVFNFRHPSPTLVMEGALRLSELVPWVKLKDASGASFPGDHGTALIMFTVLTGFYAGWRLGGIAALAAVFFVLPRLMSGAHWFSDVAVGSVSVALVGLALALATPLHALVIRALSSVISRCVELLLLVKTRLGGASGG